MVLWTWQGLDFDPLIDRVDRSKSEYFTCPPFANLPRAYAELDELLSLPTDREHQFVWCYTTDSWVHHPWYARCIWPVEVPQKAILAYVDDSMWERLIGSGSVPADIHEQWCHELWSSHCFDERFDQELARKAREYHAACPPRAECLRALLRPTGPGPNVLALVPVPFDASWIRAYDLTRRNPGLARAARMRQNAILPRS